MLRVAAPFSPPRPLCTHWSARDVSLLLADDEQRERLTRLGFDERELNRIASDNKDEQKVAVTEVEVDPFTLTAIGFALLAFNFLVFANLGDGGIAGIVARIINTWDN